MNIDVRFRGQLSSGPLKEHIQDRARVRLERFAHDLSSVVVLVSDSNGPKGGVDKSCKVTVTGPHLDTHAVEKTASDAYAAADQALETAQHTILKLLEKRRSTERRHAEPEAVG